MWEGIAPFTILITLGPLIVVVTAIIGNSIVTHQAGRKAEKAAAEAARLLLKADVKLDSIQKTTDNTHTIVNSQRTTMLRMVAVLARRVAKENPDDDAAQRAADEAENDADEARKI